MAENIEKFLLFLELFYLLLKALILSSAKGAKTL